MAEERYREFEALDKLPSDWPNAVAAFLSPISNVNLATKNANTIKVPVDAQQQLSLGVDGLWRYVSAEVDATVPAGAAQTYDIVATTTANVFKAPTKEGEGESDETNYNFALQVVKAGTLPSGGSIAGAQKIGEVDWDGAKIIGVRQLVGDLRATDVLTPTQPLVSVSPLTIVGIKEPTAPLIKVKAVEAADVIFESLVGATTEFEITAAGSFVWPAAGVTMTAAGGVVDVNGVAVVLSNDARLGAAREPAGAAGGDLSGTYPNPTVSHVLGGQAPVSTTTAISGDLTGTLPSPTIPAIAPVASVMSYAGFADPNVRWLLADGRALSRTTYAVLMSLTTQVLICGVTAASKVLKPATSGLVIPIGAAVEGTGIPAGTTVLSHEGVNLVLSQAATATGAAISCVFFPFGNGNGTTTFNMPRIAAGRIIIGSAAGTTGSWPVGTLSGEEYVTLTLAQMPEHRHTVSDPGHAHGTTDPRHTHPDPGHAHGITDPGHGHGVNAWTANNPAGGGTIGNAWTVGVGFTNPSFDGVNTGIATNSGTGIGIVGAFAGLGSALTGIGVNAASTGVGLAFSGSSERHPNMQPSVAMNHIVRVL